MTIIQKGNKVYEIVVNAVSQTEHAEATEVDAYDHL
jgi:hypothetical protein